MTRPVCRTVGGLLIASLLVAVAVVPVGATPSNELVGTFKLTSGSYSGSKPHGTWFRMIYPGGTKYFPNPDSKASNKTYTLGRAGTDGGLTTGRFQPHPDPAFDGAGNARANKIIKPQPFTGIRFTVATLKTDPQSSKTVPAPSARFSGRRLTMQLQGYTAQWNTQSFNQGAPKPDGSGSPAKGTYNPATKRFVLQWTSKIAGGPFNGFSGFWHLEGTFSPRGAQPTTRSRSER
ncbi:MAG: hypothetical protein QOK16_4312 [Solirubrobacteraceae bacterium]|jgi:hypothetical protein|nr:hypothetical protein [Solirubrobacteraceae bacterium]